MDPSMNISTQVQTCKPVICARAQSIARAARVACQIDDSREPALESIALTLALTSSANEARLAASLLACVSKTGRHSMDFLLRKYKIVLKTAPFYYIYFLTSHHTPAEPTKLINFADKKHKMMF